jgi:hypothetical protein
MMPLLLSLALHAPAPVTCGENDAPCLRRMLLAKVEEVESLQRELALSQRLVVVLREENAILSQSLAALQKDARAVAVASTTPWYNTPIFLLSVGVVSGVGLTAVAAWSVSQAARAN